MFKLALFLLFVLLLILSIDKFPEKNSEPLPENVPRSNLSATPTFAVYDSFENAVSAGGGFYHLADPAFPYPGASYVVPVKTKLSKQKESVIAGAILYKVRGYWQLNEPITMIQDYYNSGNKKYLIFMVNPIACS